ncbi:MAG: hypothetical protein WCF94_02820 [bacterium]
MTKQKIHEKGGMVVIRERDGKIPRVTYSWTGSEEDARDVSRIYGQLFDEVLQIRKNKIIEENLKIKVSSI